MCRVRSGWDRRPGSERPDRLRDPAVRLRLNATPRWLVPAPRGLERAPGMYALVDHAPTWLSARPSFSRGVRLTLPERTLLCATPSMKVWALRTLSELVRQQTDASRAEAMKDPGIFTDPLFRAPRGY